MGQQVMTGVLSVRRQNRHAALVLASFGALLAFLDVTIVNVAFPSIRKSFPTASIGDLSWVLNSYNIAFAALLVAAGRLADVFGRRRTFTVGIVVFTLSSAVCAVAPSVGLLIGARIAQAVGAGLLVPASLALVVEAFPVERRAHAVGLWGATAAFAAGIGPPLGGALVELDSWRLAFLVNLPLGIVALACTHRFLVESRSPGRRRLPDLRGAALLGLAVGSVTLAITEGPTRGWTDLRVVAAFAGSALLATAFAWSSRTHPVPVLDATLLRIPTFGIANVVTFVAGMGFYAYMLNNILWLNYVWDWSLLRAGLAVAPGAVVAVVAAGVLGRVADKHGARVVAVPGALVWTGAYLWYEFAVGTTPNFFGEWLPGQVLSGLGVGATLPILAAAALAAVPGGRYATASAVVSSTRQLGAVLGVALLVVIVGTPATAAAAAAAFRDGWILSIVCFAVAAVGSLFLRRTAPTDVQETPAPAPADVRVGGLVTAAAPAISRSPVLANLRRTTRTRLLDGGEEIVLPGGRWLFRQGDPTDGLYVVRSGRLDVLSDDRLVRELVAGDVVGELGVLTDAPRSAGVRARRDSVLCKVTAQQFDAVIRRDATTLRALTRSLAEQLQEHRGGTAATTRLPHVVAVVGVGDGAPVRQAAELLEKALAGHLRVLRAESMTSEELYRAESDFDRVLLVSPNGNGRWRAFCLRQADRVVVVAASDSAPPDIPASSGCYAVLVGPPAGRTRLVQWHDALAPRFVQQADGDSLPAAMASLAARLSGRSIGLALAGGGARAFAAIGVIEELEAAGFSIDRLAGCSVGSVVAALFATGRDAAAVDAACYEEFVRRNPFNDYRLPTVSLVRGRKTESAISRHLGETVFEELPRELTVVSTDLIHRQLVVHRRGPVGPCIRASLSVPGLYPPVRIGDQLHVDGGVLDNLPVGPLTDFEEGPVVAVNIAAAGSSTSSGGPRMPSLGETLLRTMLMAGTSNLDDARRRAAVVVTPDTRGIGLLEFHQMDRAREAGRVAGQAAAEALRDVLLGAAVPQQRSAPDVIDLAGTDRRTAPSTRPARRR
jgi:NTE family protein